MGNSIWSSSWSSFISDIGRAPEDLEKYCRDPTDKPEGCIQCDTCQSLIYYKTVKDVIEHMQKCITSEKEHHTLTTIGKEHHTLTTIGKEQSTLDKDQRRVYCNYCKSWVHFQNVEDLRKHHLEYHLYE